MCYYGSMNTEYVVQRYYECKGEVFKDSADAIKKHNESRGEIRSVYIILQREESIQVQELGEYGEYYSFDPEEVLMEYKRNFANICEYCEEWYDEGIFVQNEAISDFCSRECMSDFYGEDKAEIFEAEEKVDEKSCLKI